MKKLFRNYSLEFDKNERKLIKTLAQQVLKQTAGSKEHYQIEKVFQSILEKMNDPSEATKLTKVEFNQLKLQITENIKHLESEIKNAWFLKKWFYRPLLSQYQNIYESHFKG